MAVTHIYERELTEALKNEILQLQHAAFAQQPLFVHQRWCGTPLADDDLWFIMRMGERLTASVRLVHRNIVTPKGKFAVGGVANVCSHPDARGTGAAGACMTAAQEYIADSSNIDFGLLFTGSAYGFYSKLGWHDVSNPIVPRDDKGVRLPPKHGNGGHSMIFPGSCPLSEWPEGEIDLNGPDW